MADTKTAPILAAADLATANIYGEKPGAPTTLVRVAMSSILALISSAASGYKIYATIALRNADTQPNGTVGYVFANNDDPADPLNGYYQADDTDPDGWVEAPWIAAYFERAVQPLVDDAAAAAALAGTRADAADEAKVATEAILTDAAAGMEFAGALGAPEIEGETRPLIASFNARDDGDLLYSLLAFVQSIDGVDIVSSPMSRFVTGKLGGVVLSNVTAADRSLIEAQLGPDGTLYEIGAIDAGGKQVQTRPSPATAGWPHYMQFIVHGQSLGEGAEAFTSAGAAATTEDQGWGSRRFFRGDRTWIGTDWPTRPEKRPGMTSLVPLTGQVVGGLGEQVGNGMADAFKARIVGRYGLADADALTPNIVFSSAIRGSTRLTAITSEDTGNVTTSTSTTNVAIGTGAKTFTFAAGLPLTPGETVRVANNAANTSLDYSPYMQGTITSYNVGTGELIINATDASLAGLVNHNDWRLIRDTWSAPGNFWNTMLADVTALSALAAAEGKTHAVGAFLHMQGERNSDLKIYEYDAAAVSLSAAIASYKAKFVAYAGEVQTAIKAITGQRQVPFLTYQTLSNPAAQAQLDAAIENPALITMVGPTYAVPRAWNGSRGTGGAQLWGDPIHLAADGSRMFGELAAKVRWQIENGEHFEPVRPIFAVKVDATHFDVTFHVPKPPLVLDTNFIAKAIGFGFTVFPGSVDAPGIEVPVTDALVIAPNVVRFTTGANIPAQGKLWCGRSAYCDLGSNPAVTGVADGPNTTHGFPTKILTLAGDRRALLAPLSNEGVFLAAKTGSLGVRGIVRSVAFTGGNTELTFEVRDSAGAFAPGDTLTFARGQPFANLRDSDPTASIYTFVDAGYPARFGKPYPLWNWCALFAAFPIQGA